jgi:hypothetical protein
MSRGKSGKKSRRFALGHSDLSRLLNCVHSFAFRMDANGEINPGGNCHFFAACLQKPEKKRESNVPVDVYIRVAKFTLHTFFWSRGFFDSGFFRFTHQLCLWDCTQ